MAGALVTTNVLQTLVAMGLSALREKIVMPRVVNRNYEQEIVGVRKGSTVNVSVPAAIATRAVVPDVVPPAVTAVTPTSVPITLDQWQEAPFAMDDKGIAQVLDGIIPMQASEALKALANTIDQFIWGLTHDGNGFYGFAGVGGTTPFATNVSEYLTARKFANQQLMPMEDRFMIINPDAEANALGLRAFQDASFRGDQGGIINGQIGTKLGASWIMTQNVPEHTEPADLVGAIDDAIGLAVGTKDLVVDGFSAAPNAGDIITIAGDSQTYVLTGTPTTTALSIEPGLKVAIPTADGDEVITVKPTHQMNLLLHRDAIAFAMAPLEQTKLTANENVAVAIDEESGLSLRLELTRQHKQYQWSWDALYGGKVIRRELGVRLAG